MRAERDEMAPVLRTCPDCGREFTLQTERQIASGTQPNGDWKCPKDRP